MAKTDGVARIIALAALGKDGGGSTGGTTNYLELANKPKINNVELTGNKTLEDLGINIPDLENYYTKEEINNTFPTTEAVDKTFEAYGKETKEYTDKVAKGLKVLKVTGETGTLTDEEYSAILKEPYNYVVLGLGDPLYYCGQSGLVGDHIWSSAYSYTMGYPYDNMFYNSGKYFYLKLETKSWSVEEKNEAVQGPLIDHYGISLPNSLMKDALSDTKYYNEGVTFICSDDGDYKKGHIYTIKVDKNGVKSWEDVTPKEPSGGTDANAVYTYYAPYSDEDWFTEENVANILQTVKDKGYSNFELCTLNGSHYALRKGGNLQALTTTEEYYELEFLQNDLKYYTFYTFSAKLDENGKIVAEHLLKNDLTAEEVLHNLLPLTLKDFPGYDSSASHLMLQSNEGNIEWDSSLDGGVFGDSYTDPTYYTEKQVDKIVTDTVNEVLGGKY